jgi:hypothetical protein
MQIEPKARAIMIAMTDISQEPEKKEMYLKIHQHEAETLIAVCDCDILGKKFTDGRLKIEVTADFFSGEKASCSEVEAALKAATMANFVGSKAVEHAISLGYVERDCTLSIDGVPYAQMVRM